MAKVLKVGGISIKASPAKDKKGRNGYFISASEIDTHTKVVISTAPKKVKKRIAIRPEVEELLTEMKQYKEGKIKLRSFDDFIQTV